MSLVSCSNKLTGARSRSLLVLARARVTIYIGTLVHGDGTFIAFLLQMEPVIINWYAHVK